MRIFKKVLLVLLVLFFVFNICLSIAIFSSSTNKLLFKNTLESRLELYHNSSAAVEKSKEFTIRSHTFSDNTFSDISCVANEENTTSSLWSCKMISKLYDDNNNLIRTSYFPGDGYMYSVEGEVKTKTIFANSSLESYFNSLLLGTTYTYYMIADAYDSEKEFVSTDVSSKFDFNTFSIIKTVNCTYNNINTNYELKFTFDGKDRITDIFFKDYGTFEISYVSTNLNIINLSSFN